MRVEIHTCDPEVAEKDNLAKQVEDFIDSLGYFVDEVVVVGRGL